MLLFIATSNRCRGNGGVCYDVPNIHYVVDDMGLLVVIRIEDIVYIHEGCNNTIHMADNMNHMNGVHNQIIIGGIIII